MSLLDNFIRVNRNRRCPVCEKPDWCLVSKDDPTLPAMAICARIESEVRRGEAGWLHVFDDRPHHRQPRYRRVLMDVRQDIDYSDEAQCYAEAGSEGMVSQLACKLGVSDESLHRLRVGWCGGHWAYTFPLSNYAGVIVGINRRFSNGKKMVFPGHRTGMYLPCDLPTDLSGQTLLITEGGSDTAAGLDFGYWTVGRFSCTSGLQQLQKLIKRRTPRRVVIIADADEPGRRGAVSLAKSLRRFCLYLDVVEPPVNDLRQWRRDGATADDLRHLLDTTPNGSEVHGA